MRSRPPSTHATHEAGVEVDPRLASRFERLFPGCIGGPLNLLFRVVGAGTEMSRLCEQARHGDCRAAVVIAVNPVVIAAYSDELDDVALLKFDQDFIGEIGFAVGNCLVSANSYLKEHPSSYARDVSQGKFSTGRYVNFHPVILDFITRDQSRLDTLRSQIEHDEWTRAYELGVEKLASRPELLRYGSPFRSMEAIQIRKHG